MPCADFISVCTGRPKCPKRNLAEPYQALIYDHMKTVCVVESLLFLPASFS